MKAHPASAPAPSEPPSASFRDLGLAEAVLAAVADVGYEAPSPIQAATIPVLLSGADMLGQAQTGTGKTAAFALPALSRLDLALHEPQVLVLVPTRELALQVAEAFQRYAARLPGFHVLPIYGGQSYQPQLTALRRGVHVVVGTPGRVIDHIERGTLKLERLTLLVLDEADEMLQMGFVDAVESILERTPPRRQVALFSATMPAAIRRIAARHLPAAVSVTIESRTRTATTIHQRYWLVSGVHKLDALTRILEAETFDGMLVFTRTKQSTVDLAQKLQARGFAAEPLNGDIAQALRERAVARFKAGESDILVATDVAARGLDVERISHVVNYDVPYDTESYVHRIGRTGRAGRSGEAILFVAPRERNMLRSIERATRQPVEQMHLPSVETVNLRRLAKFKQRILETIASPRTQAYRQILQRIEQESGSPLADIAAALAVLAQGAEPLLLEAKHGEAPSAPQPSAIKETPAQATQPSAATATPARAARPAATREPSARTAPPPGGRRAQFAERETFRVEVGAAHGVKPGNIVGAIANEAGIDGAHIGRIDIRDDHSFVDLPAGMPAPIFKRLQRARVGGRPLAIARVAEKPPKPRRDPAGRHGTSPGSPRKA
ncbi:MAG TPA: DEAD/DEAH box helicase [Steroidobacteraceae bacterium]|nr:DEAD/DEAH box helicase [Steroidobacteraceae bacterium]